MQARSLFNKPRKHREAKKKHNECGVNTTSHTEGAYPRLNRHADIRHRNPLTQRSCKIRSIRRKGSAAPHKS